jgi:quinol monooxygenase YgiN
MISTSLHLYSEFRLTTDALRDLDASIFEDFVRQTRAEPGCSKAELFQQGNEEDIFMLIAEFENEEALQAHLEADWRHESVRKLRPMLEEGLRRFTMHRLA